jgi:hypothetical protein
MALPSSLWEEEDELLRVWILNDQPFARALCATLYSGGQGYNGHMRPGDTNYTPNRTCWLWQRPLTLPWLLSMGLNIPVPCTSWTVTLPLWGKDCTCAQWGLVNHHCAPYHYDLPPCLAESLLDCRDMTPLLTSISRIWPLAISWTYVPDQRPMKVG